MLWGIWLLVTLRKKKTAWDNFMTDMADVTDLTGMTDTADTPWNYETVRR